MFQNQAPSQPLPIYVINLDRAAGRMAQIMKQSLSLRIAISRVTGIDGAAIPVAEWQGVDHARFIARHGRTILPGEYGCYRSHLAALAQLVQDDEAQGIIIEDDIALDDRLVDRAHAAMAAVPNADLIKLVNHRHNGFRFHASSTKGDLIGRCFFGPQGSAACYIVTRSGAQKLLQALKVMSLPWDVALERGWATKTSVFATAADIVEFGPYRCGTMIGKRRDYQATKLPRWQRLPTYLFRTSEFFRRTAYALFPIT